MRIKDLADVTKLSSSDEGDQECKRMVETPYGFRVCKAPGRFVSNGMLCSYNTWLCEEHLLESAVGRERLRVL